MLRTQRITLSQDVAVRAANALETRCVFDEIFRREIYLQNGIHIRDGDCVFDIGANIGLFTLYALNKAAGVRVFAFEPVPDVFHIFAANTAAQRERGVVRAFNVGLGSCCQEVIFDFNPFMTIWATSRQSDVSGAVLAEARRGALFAATVSDVANAGAMSRNVARTILLGLRLPVVRPVLLLSAAVWWLAVRVRQARAGKRLKCRLITASDAIRDAGLQQVDLMKIDVEGGELDVLLGIADGDWPRIRQIALEVHDINGRLGHIIELLEAKGYTVTTGANRSEMARLSGVHMVYARRAEGT